MTILPLSVIGPVHGDWNSIASFVRAVRSAIPFTLPMSGVMSTARLSWPALLAKPHKARSGGFGDGSDS